MWVYEKKLQFPVKIKNPDPRAASVIISQLGGPYGKSVYPVPKERAQPHKWNCAFAYYRYSPKKMPATAEQIAANA